MKQPAVVEIFIAKDPTDAMRPRQYAECRWIGDDRDIGRTGHLIEAHTAAARERSEDAGARGIERGRGDADIVAVGQRRDESGNREGLRARIAVHIAPREPDKMQLFSRDTSHDLGSEPLLLVAPQAVPFDERLLPAHRHLMKKIQPKINESTFL
jgi:hypothetical protein